MHLQEVYGVTLLDCTLAYFVAILLTFHCSLLGDLMFLLSHHVILVTINIFLHIVAMSTL